MDARTPNWDLAGLLSVLRRRRRWITGAVVVAVVLAIALSLVTTPVYRATAEVLVEPEVETTDPDMAGRVFFMEQELQTQLQLMESEVVGARVAEALSLGIAPRDVLDKARASVLPETRVIQIVASDTDPERAAQLAQAFADEYLTFRREDAAERLAEASASIRARLDSARQEVARLDEEIAATEDSGRLGSLLSERDAVTDEVADLDSQLGQLEAADAVARGGGRVIRAAEVPTSPSEPNPLRNTIVAVILGLGLGVVIALVVDSIDDAIHTSDDAATVSQRPVLGRIPLASEGEGGDLPVLRGTSGLAAESFRDLRTNLRFVGQDGPPHVVLVTSSIQGEGKSVIAANLALASAAADRSVVLVDADLRRPTVGRMFRHEDVAGLSTVLSGEHTLDETLNTVAGTGLDLLLSGDSPPNPSELVGTTRMEQVIAQLAAEYDLVVIDSPPVLVVPDVLEYAGVADTTLLVVEIERATRREVRETVERLTRAGARVPGVVVNRSDLDASRYGYDYYYAAE